MNDQWVIVSVLKRRSFEPESDDAAIRSCRTEPEQLQSRTRSWDRHHDAFRLQKEIVLTPTTQKKHRCLKLSLLYFVLMFIGFPMGVFIHECGHWAAATTFGWKTTFRAAMVGWTHSPPPPASSIIMFLIAGVLCDVIFVGLGLILLRRYQPLANREFSFALPVGTLLTTFSIRWALSPVFVMINSSDEALVSSLLGLNQWVVPIGTLPIGIGVVTYLISVHVRSNTVIPWIVGAFGAFCGLGLWVNVVGPMLYN